MKNLTLGLVSHTFNDKKGGKEIILWELVEGLLNKNVSVHVFANKCRIIEHPNFHVHKVKKIGKLIGMHKWLFAKLAQRAVNKVDLDLVFTNGNVGFGDVIRLGGMPYRRRQELMEKYGVQSSCLRKCSLKKRLSHQLEKRSVYNSNLNKIIAVSTLVRDEFIQYYEGLETNKFEVIPNGLTYTEFDQKKYAVNRKKIREKYSISSDTPLILFVGNNFKLKGLQRIYKLLNEIKEARLLVVGSDSTEVPVELSSRVDFVGWVKEVEPFYDAADYFCLPSYADGFGLVVLEALARGCYVFLSEKVGAKDIINSSACGFVFERIKEVATIVGSKKFINDSNKAARRKYARTFSRNKMVDSYLEVFSSCIED